MNGECLERPPADCDQSLGGICGMKRIGATHPLVPPALCVRGGPAQGTWGERWLVTTEHTDPGFVLWAWTKYYLNPGTLP